MSETTLQESMPYTVVSHTSIPTPRFSIMLTAEGIKELAKRTKKGDRVRIEQWVDFTEKCEKQKYYQTIEIIKK